MKPYQRKRFKNSDMPPWSDLKHEILIIVMMKLGVVDFVSFSGVCKSWRSLARSNRNTFMVSKPPMSIGIQLRDYKDSYCYLEDFQGRRFRTIIPHSAGRICIGVTFGFLIFFRKETHDFWLVNPITRHQLHFPDYKSHIPYDGEGIRATLVLAPSIPGWAFVILNKKVSFCLLGKKQWIHVKSRVHTPGVLDLHAFKGKIYTLHKDYSIYELRLGPMKNYRWTLIETKNFLKPELLHVELVSSSDFLYVINKYRKPIKLLVLDFEEMKWSSPERTLEGYAFFISKMKSCVGIKPKSWVGPRTPYKSYNYFLYTAKYRNHMFHYNWMWYFPHDCCNASLLDRARAHNILVAEATIAKIMAEEKKVDDMSACIEKLKKFGWDAQHPFYRTAILLFGESCDLRKLWLLLKVEACDIWIRNAGRKFGLLD